MRPAIVITMIMAIFIATVTAGKHKKTPCDMGTDGYNTCLDVSIRVTMFVELLLT